MLLRVEVGVPIPACDSHPSSRAVSSRPSASCQSWILVPSLPPSSQDLVHTRGVSIHGAG